MLTLQTSEDFHVTTGQDCARKLFPIPDTQNHYLKRCLTINNHDYYLRLLDKYFMSIIAIFELVAKGK